MSWWLFILSLAVVLMGFTAFFGAPYVPSRRKYIIRAFDRLYRIGKKDVVVDLGSGDGVVLRQISARGALAIGYELNPILFLVSKWLCRGDKNITIHLQNYWHMQLPSNTTLVYIFGVNRDTKKLLKKLQAEARRLGHPFKLLCYGSPPSGLAIDARFEGYSLHTVYPLQPSKASV